MEASVAWLCPGHRPWDPFHPLPPRLEPSRGRLGPRRRSRSDRCPRASGDVADYRMRAPDRPARPGLTGALPTLPLPHRCAAMRGRWQVVEPEKFSIVARRARRGRTSCRSLPGAAARDVWAAKLRPGRGIGEWRPNGAAGLDGTPGAERQPDRSALGLIELCPIAALRRSHRSLDRHPDPARRGSRDSRRPRGGNRIGRSQPGHRGRDS
jgi:hypothetical protein